MKNVLFVVVLFLAACVFADANGKDDMIRVGGKGRVAIVNTCAASTNALAKVARKFDNLLKVDIAIKTGGPWTFADAGRCFDAANATVAVFVVKDRNLPMSLVALESKWGVANVEGLDDDCAAKLVTRVLTSILGGGASKYPSSAMRPVFSRDDLAKKAGLGLAVDTAMSIFNYLPATGVEPYRLMSREDAIEEGLIKAGESK